MSNFSSDRSPAYVVMQRIFDEGFTKGDTAVVDEVCSPDLIEHQFGLAGVGGDAVRHVKAAIEDVHRAFPDIVFTVEDAVESGTPSGSASAVAGPPPGPTSAPRAATRSISPSSTLRASSTDASW